MARVVEAHENFTAAAVMISLVGPDEVRTAQFTCTAATNHLRNALQEWAADTTDDQEKVTAVVERARALAPARSALIDALQDVLARALPVSREQGAQTS
jgi:nitrate/nitrite-specific signal transduction histidine kinase